MHIKQKILFSLVLTSFLSFTFSSSNLAQVASEDYELYYSDLIAPSVVLEWNVVTFIKEADFNWTLASDHLVEEGDTIRFEVKQDPDYFNLTDVEALQYTKGWADIFLNDVNLSAAEEWDYYVDGFDEMDDYDWGYLLPPERDSSTGKINYFEGIYADTQPDCFNNETGILEVSLTSDLFNLRWESYESGETPVSSEPFERIKIVEISYNLAWGYLDRLRVYESYEQGVIDEEEQELFELILLNSKSTQTQGTPIKWISGLIALFTLGMIMVRIGRH